MIEFRAWRTDYNDRVRVGAGEFDSAGNVVAIVTQVRDGMFTIDRVTPETAGEDRESLLNLNMREAESLITALWKEGVRPIGRPDPAPELDAVKNHLQDMRTLVFASLTDPVAPPPLAKP